eukprot:6204145-Pleurochrysis_carterae.AAC.5
MFFQAVRRARINFGCSSVSSIISICPRIRNWSRVFVKYQHASAFALRKICPCFSLRASVMKVSWQVSQSHPRNTTVRTAGKAESALNVASWRYLAVGSRDAR